MSEEVTSPHVKLEEKTLSCRPWCNSIAVPKLKNMLPKSLRDTWLMMGQGNVTRVVILVFLLLLTVAPIVLVTRGFDLERVAIYGYVGVFVAAFASSTTIIFPTPGIAVAVVAAAYLNPALVALVAAVGATLGEFTGYLAGYWGKIAIGDKYGGRYLKAEDWMKRHGNLTLFLFAFLPFLVFDFTGIAAGALRFPFRKFLLACFAGRLPRSFIEAYLGWWILPHFMH